MKYKILILLVSLSILGCNSNKPNIPKVDLKPQLIVEEPNDSILKEQLELIRVEDQTLRFLLPDVTEKFGRESKEYTYIWSLINRQDSICINKLIQIVDKHGWLGKSRVGDNANQAIWLIMQHSELEIQEKYLPLLKESVANGESEGWHLAFLEDRILMYSKKKQKFGTQAVWDNELKQNKIYPIEDVKNVNHRRQKLGLEPIEKYAESNGHIFDQKE
ncbi:MAG: DUF6624 domain-containing protein [Crocinitomicaceae bacterium]